MIKTLAKSIREYKLPSILSIVFIILEVSMECVLPFVTSKLVDQMSNSNYKMLTIYSIILVLMAMLSLLFGILSGKFSAKASSGFAKNLRKDMYENINNFSFSNIDKFQSSSLVTRMTTDVTNVQMAYMMIVRVAFRSPLMLIFSIVMAFVMAPSLAWIFLIIAPILLIVFILIIVLSMPRFKRVFKKYDELNNSIQENISGIRVVKSYVREDYEREKFNKATTSLQKEFTNAERIVALNSPAMQFSINTLMLLILLLGSIIIVNPKNSSFVDGVYIFNKLSVGQMQGLVTYGVQSLMALMMLSMIIVMITMAIESAIRICEVLNEKSDLTNPENPIYEVMDGSIKFENVSFKYSQDALKYALSDINLEIKSGQTIGILGGTGSSKTSLVNLISRLYDVTKGACYVGGHNVKEYDIETLRNEVAVVLQKNLLFSGTIKENLRWGNKNATDEEIEEACRLACASEFIESFPDKYDTYIEQGGTNVSGGQKQRLCIARALLKKPKVLILDDSTSAVDTKTDALIRKSFKEYIPNTTKIIIAQRVSSIEDSDQIIVMDNGTINACGTHEELLANNAIYQEVYYSQNKVNSNGGEE
ncbi:MAG: ABC transporter ATP-binding protein [Anaeroplasmataceae bacterium]